MNTHILSQYESVIGVLQSHLPQGMVDPGDTVSRTLRREFGEEAMNSLEMSEEEKKAIERQIHEFFQEGKQVYPGL